MTSEYKLSIDVVKSSELPPRERVIEQGHALLEGTQSWKQGKTVHPSVRLYSRAKASGEPASWHCRLSEHAPEEATFDELWELLGVNKGLNEMHFVHEIKKATLVKQISPTQAIWSMYYHFPPPFSPRVFTVYQVSEFNDAHPRSAMIVSIPVDLSDDPELLKLEEKAVKGRYVSAEWMKELPDGKVEWRMATSSRAEGSLPQFLTERAMPSSISNDVPKLLKYLHSIRPGAQKEDKKHEEADMQAAPTVMPHGPGNVGALA